LTRGPVCAFIPTCRVWIRRNGPSMFSNTRMCYFSSFKTINSLDFWLR
jgi:hypothetical protein